MLVSLQGISHVARSPLPSPRTTICLVHLCQKNVPIRCFINILADLHRGVGGKKFIGSLFLPNLHGKHHAAELPNQTESRQGVAHCQPSRGRQQPRAQFQGSTMVLQIPCWLLPRPGKALSRLEQEWLTGFLTQHCVAGSPAGWHAGQHSRSGPRKGCRAGGQNRGGLPICHPQKGPMEG